MYKVVTKDNNIGDAPIGASPMLFIQAVSTKRPSFR